VVRGLSLREIDIGEARDPARPGPTPNRIEASILLDGTMTGGARERRHDYRGCEGATDGTAMGGARERRTATRDGDPYVEPESKRADERVG